MERYNFFFPSVHFCALKTMPMIRGKARTEKETCPRLWTPGAAPRPPASGSPSAAAAMPSSVLWAVDLFGKVYTLSTAGQYWELCKDSQLEFKRVSATTQCCWGIACDNQVYVYVCASDVPIRRREEAYENQVGSRVFAGAALGRSSGKEIAPPQPFMSLIALEVRVV